MSFIFLSVVLRPNTVNQLNFAAVEFRGFGPFWSIVGDFPYTVEPRYKDHLWAAAKVVFIVMVTNFTKWVTNRAHWITKIYVTKVRLYNPI